MILIAGLLIVPLFLLVSYYIFRFLKNKNINPFLKVLIGIILSVLEWYSASSIELYLSLHVPFFSDSQFTRDEMFLLTDTVFIVLYAIVFLVFNLVFSLLKKQKNS